MLPRARTLVRDNTGVAILIKCRLPVSVGVEHLATKSEEDDQLKGRAARYAATHSAGTAAGSPEGAARPLRRIIQLCSSSR
jgi:phage gpG-like protein